MTDLRMNEVLNIGFKVVITPEDIDDIMVSALEGGINYWADEAKVEEDKRVAAWGHERISRGRCLKIHTMEPFDEDDTEWYELTKEKFLKGIERYIAQPTSGDFLEFVDHELRIDAGNVDAVVADAIIQYALFGEIIYG